MTSTGTRVTLRPLRLVDEGDDVLVGDPEAGTFISVPQVGAAVIRALQRGETVESAAEEARRLAGEVVDVVGFVEALREVGFICDDQSPHQPARSAVIQSRRWFGGIRPELVRPLFGRTAWTCYALAFVFDVSCFVGMPDLWPRPTDVFVAGTPGPSLLLVLPIVVTGLVFHEGAHWLAGRAAGIAARFGLDRRAFFLVAETDLTQLWTLPRKQRYGPQLAGLAADAVLLSALLALELAETAGLRPGTWVGGVIAAGVIVTVLRMLWQCMVFLRTDLYGVLVTATNCRNLWRVKTLLLRRAFGRLTPDERAELAAADPRDVSVGTWFRWVWLAGQGVLVAYFLWFSLPVLVGLAGWSWAGLRDGPAAPGFFSVLGWSVVLFGGQLGWTMILAISGIRTLRARGLRRSAARR